MGYDQREEDALWQAAMRDGAAQAAGVALAAYERQVIAHVFKAGGVHNGLAQLAARAREEIGEPTVSLRLFNAHAGFPARLVAARLKLVEMPMGDVFKRPTATPIHRAYVEAVEEYPEEQALVLVFRWRGFGERMVLHTLPREFGEPGQASRTKLVYAVGRANLPPMIYTIESMDGLLAAIGWARPDAERAVRLPGKPRVRRGPRGRPGGQAGGD
ncbi:MAG TPA: hypothetical protein VGH33_25165 [Isosphaeraceae bacterium]|jgi:hypothetical protein